MKILATMTLAFALPLAAVSFAQNTPDAAPSPGQIVGSASPAEWVTIPAEDLLVMTLAPDAQGNPREVIIQLIPKPFSQGWVDNIRLLARSEWYDDTAIIRVQDNYVTQWGDPGAEDEATAKPLPEGLKVMEEEEYEVSITQPDLNRALASYLSSYSKVNEETGRTVLTVPARDAYDPMPLHVDGWPASLHFRKNTADTVTPVHCYGMVGVARDMSPNTGDGSSLYTVIGHAPRHLDRNIALVGRVIEGMEHLSSLPRGKGDLGFYKDPAKQTTILSVQIASDIAEFPQAIFEYLSTEGETFAKYAEARANRRDPFFIMPAGGADICNIPVPVRRVVTD